MMFTIFDWLVNLFSRIFSQLDDCEICGGKRGGVPGNENIEFIAGERIIMCDYCSADQMTKNRNRILDGDLNYDANNTSTLDS